MTQQMQSMPRIVFVTGPSGAGRSTALRALEDQGFETIDNLPLSLLQHVLAAPPRQPLALGLDVRNRDFGVDKLTAIITSTRQSPALDCSLLYLDASEDVLQRRYSETRRRHPMAELGSALQGIRKECALLEPVRAMADVLIDTTNLTPHALRRDVIGQIIGEQGGHLQITLQSFSYKRGLPRGLDMALDCRFLRNPHWDPSLRALTGLSKDVADFVRADDRHAPFVKQVVDMLTFLLPAYRDEGKSHFCVGFGCTGGQHRSVMMTEQIAQTLASKGWHVSINHRELERLGGADKGSVV